MKVEKNRTGLVYFIEDEKDGNILSVVVKGMTTKQRKQAIRKLQIDFLEGKRDLTKKENEDLKKLIKDNPNILEDNPSPKKKAKKKTTKKKATKKKEE